MQRDPQGGFRFQPDGHGDVSVRQKLGWRGRRQHRDGQRGVGLDHRGAGLDDLIIVANTEVNTDDDRKALGAMVDATINKLMHPPTMALRAMAGTVEGASAEAVVRSLFALDEAPQSVRPSKDLG